MKSEDIISLLLPEGMLKLFDIIEVEESGKKLTIHLDEKNNPPKSQKGKKLTSKGFTEPVTIQDFPLRGKALYLQIRKRRWTVDQTGEVIHNNLKLAESGTRLTKELAAFLKGTN